MRRALLLTLLFLALPPSIAQAEPDMRMQVELDAEKAGVKPTWLHSHIKEAAEMALPQLWQRIVPQHALGQIPEHAKAVRFLKRAIPNETGVTILFSGKRVFSYLKQHRIPYYAEQSATQPVTLPAAATLIEPTATEQTAAQPAASLPDISTAAAPLITMLTIEHHASLPEQVLLEQDLSNDPHVQRLTLKRVSRFGEQYQLLLKQPDDHWLAAWFAHRGMTITQSVDGWVAR